MSLKGCIIFRLPTPSSVKIKVLVSLTCAALSATDTEFADVSEFADLVLLPLQATSIIVAMLNRNKFFILIIFTFKKLIKSLRYHFATLSTEN